MIALQGAGFLAREGATLGGSPSIFG
jgi:hypothetical protein